MKPNPAWGVFYAILIVIFTAGELVGVGVDGARDSFSAQVWYILDTWPAWRWPLVIGIGAGAGWLIEHFTRRHGGA